MTKRFGLAALAALALALTAQAQDQGVDRTEVASAQGAAIEFINYEGPQAVIETAASIRGIGLALGTAVARGAERSGEVGRYYVIHAVDPSVKTGFDADIIGLGEGSRVDHIRNLRRIVAGYLESAYGYSAKDADTLAIFITVYNAVYRGKLDYFQSRYKPVVMKELTAGTVGLSVRWDEWAGRSRIVIPLSAFASTGVIGSVATTPITDKPTVESLKAESPTGGVAERRDVVDIKERDVEQEKAAIEAEKARIAKEEAAVAADKARIEAGKAAAEKAAADKAAPGASTPAGPAPSAVGQAEAPADAGSEKGAGQEASIAVSEKAKAEEAAVAAREAKVEADKAAVAVREEEVKAKEAEVAADRAGIASDQKDAIKGEVAAAAQKEASGVVLFELVDPNLPQSRLALVDLASGQTLRRSTINTIRAATVVDADDAYVAVAGQVTGAGGAVRLVRVAKADYSNVIQGKDDVFADSMLWKYGSSVYAVVKQGDGWAVGRFDPATLELKASSAPVSRWTFLTESGGKLVAQGPSGGFLILEAEALTTASEIKR